jgi:predicted Zn-dependent protease
LCTPLEAFFDALPVLASLQRPERLEAHVKRIAILIATCLIPALLRPQEHSPTTKMRANSRTTGEVMLNERLAREYEQQSGLGSTPELDAISRYISSVGSQVASVLPSGLQYHFVFDPNPDFESAFALPGGYIIVGGGLLAIAQTEDERITGAGLVRFHISPGQNGTLSKCGWVSEGE